MRVLVCGSRDWTDAARIGREMEKFPLSVLIEGEARGADLLAREIAESRGVEVERYPADWGRYGKAAGPIRNRQMLNEGRPDLVLAFLIGNSRGTRDMIEASRKAGVPTLVYVPDIVIGPTERYNIKDADRIDPAKPAATSS